MFFFSGLLGKMHRPLMYPVSELCICAKMCSARFDVLIEHVDRCVYFAFCGYDFVRDMFCSPRTFRDDADAKALAGAVATWARVERAVVRAVHENPFARLVFTGHSFGGAVAAVAALDVSLRTGRHVEFAGFGCPKPFNAHAARLFRERVNGTYFYTKYDLIPKLPPRTFHGAPCVCIGKSAAHTMHSYTQALHSWTRLSA